MKNKITDKKLANKRFMRTENSIIVAFLLAKGRISVSTIVKNVGISRPTFYRHHDTLNEIAPDYEDYIIKKFSQLIKPILRRKNKDLKMIYQKILVFLYYNKRIINFIYQYGDNRIIEKMIIQLKPYIISNYRLSDENLFNIYNKEVTAIIERWIQDEYDIFSITRTVENVSNITKTAYSRLAPIIR
ncbi:TetR/AcrR family transcriptional regulator [Candidatus Saccharibacteria bacterium]|nr:TetR/AcrR family transcriptional regulator [Candidatus Saccharibacteria bacterium]